MKQTKLSKREIPLLTYAISKLRPGVFSHPVWVRFSSREKPVSPKTIQDLFCEAEELQRANPGDACQVLLICAVYQNYSGHRASALTTIQKALDLAERSGLSQEILWAIWGACAICVQQADYDQAAVHFGHLQTRLNEQNEWILADYVDVVRQFCLSSATVGLEEYYNSPESQQFGGLLTLTFDWLHRWGIAAWSDSGTPLDLQISDPPSQALLARSLISPQHQQGPWHTLKLMFRGELNLDWAKNDSPHPQRKSSFWGSVLCSLRAYLSGRKIDPVIIDTKFPDSPTSQKATDDFLPSISAPKPQEESKNKLIHRNHHLVQTTTVIPVSIHMLGRFGMSIHDSALKLPASRSLSLLKYLMLNHKHKTPREVLMDVFWPDAGPETARNNLNVAIHGIRSALRSFIDLPVILYKDAAYSIAPNMQIWLDVEEFERVVNAGQRLESQNPSAAVSSYEAAISIYQGDFLEENLYEGWTVLTRESLRIAYLNTLDSLSHIYFNQQRYAACIRACQLILARDCCREDAHCMLMRCYNHQGQDHMALRQYQVCTEALRVELDVAPAPTTTQLFQQIRQHRRV